MVFKTADKILVGIAACCLLVGAVSVGVATRASLNAGASHDQAVTATSELTNLRMTLLTNCQTSHDRWSGRVDNLRADLDYLRAQTTFYGRQIDDVARSNVNGKTRIVTNYRQLRDQALDNIARKQHAIDVDPEPDCSGYRAAAFPNEGTP